MVIRERPSENERATKEERKRARVNRQEELAIELQQKTTRNNCEKLIIK
jgi:hypothetical protein